MNQVYLTRDGLAKLQADLKHLVKIVRPEATMQLKAAREHGDLSENAEYDAAKENLASIDIRIGELQMKLSQVQIIDRKDVTGEEVRILTRVKLLNLAKKTEEEFTLVDPLQSDPKKRWISVQSPIGKGLLGAKLNETVKITIPAGTLEFKVLSIELADVA